MLILFQVEVEIKLQRKKLNLDKVEDLFCCLSKYSTKTEVQKKKIGLDYEAKLVRKPENPGPSKATGLDLIIIFKVPRCDLIDCYVVNINYILWKIRSIIIQFGVMSRKEFRGLMHMNDFEVL